MSYEVKNLSKEALQKIYSVLKYIDLCSEIRNRERFIFIKEKKIEWR